MMPELTSRFAGVSSAVRSQVEDRCWRATNEQMVLSTVGAAYGTAKAGIGIAGLGTFRSALCFTSKGTS